MISTHYTLETYNVAKECLGGNEHYEQEYTVKVDPNVFESYVHGTKCAPGIYSRALRTISSERAPKDSIDTQLICWKVLENANYNADPKSDSVFTLLEKWLTKEESCLLEGQLRSALKDDASDSALNSQIPQWQKSGIYKGGMQPLALLLLQRHTLLSATRSRHTALIDLKQLPSGPFQVTVRLWVKPELASVAKKVASLVSCIDANTMSWASVAENSPKNAPLIELSRSFKSSKAYLEEVIEPEDFTKDLLLDLLVRIIASKYAQNYWVRK